MQSKINYSWIIEKSTSYKIIHNQIIHRNSLHVRSFFKFSDPLVFRYTILFLRKAHCPLMKIHLVNKPSKICKQPVSLLISLQSTHVHMNEI